MFVKQHATYKNRAFLLDNQESLEIAKIKEYYRKAFFFVDKNTFKINDGTIKTGKLFLMNCSMSYVNQSSTYNYGDFLRFVINMYTFNVEFVNGTNDFNNAICTLMEGYSNDGFSDLNTKKYFSDTQIIYDNIISNNNSDFKQSLIDMEYHSYDVMPEPKYYTSNHQFIETGEEPMMLNTVYQSFVYLFNELKDNSTSIVVLPYDQYQTFKNEKLKKLRAIRIDDELYQKQSNIDLSPIIEDLFYYNADIVLEGLIFSYDTNIGDVVISHDKRIPVTMSFSKHRFDEQKVDHILNMKDRIRNTMKMLEKEHGNILLFFSPYSYGDMLQTYFRDYNKNNQPEISNQVDKMYSLDSVVNSVATSIANEFED